MKDERLDETDLLGAKSMSGMSANVADNWRHLRFFRGAMSRVAGWNLGSLITACSALFGSFLPPGSAQEPLRPNVLLIIADDLRTELGCYGSTHAKSPHIDELAARAVRFARAYCQYPVCNPSRVSFFTGLRPDSTGVLGNELHFRKVLPHITTLPQLFRQNGYFTASLGKVFHRGLTMEETRPEMDDNKSWDVASYFQATPIGLQGEGRNLTGGKLAWCRWLAAAGDDEDQPDGQIAAEAMRLLGKKYDRPFFIAAGFHKPHDPFIAPRRYFDLYPIAGLTLFGPLESPAHDPPLALGRGGFRDAFNHFGDAEKREFLRAYLAGVSFMDAQVGKVLDALKRSAHAENTILIFLGDHGFHLGERGWWNKSTLFEHSARTPLIIFAPGRKGNGRACDHVVEFVDLYPTLAELARLTPPHPLQGRSLVSLLNDPTQSAWEGAAVTQVRRGQSAGYSVRTARWRYTEWDAGRGGAELYDHDSDSQELNNLAKVEQFASTVAEMKKLLGERITSAAGL